MNHGELKIIADNLDDIWHLYNTIEKGDLIRAVTYRTDDATTDKKRVKKAEKKKMKLGIRVEEVKFHEFSDRLRIHGVIEEGPQDKGSYHTINVTAGNQDKISIIKKKWAPHELERIKEAVDQSKQGLVFFVSLDDDTATLAFLRQSGVQWIADIESHRSGKQYESVNVENEYYGEIFALIQQQKLDETPVILLGPGFAKDHLLEFGKEKYKEICKNCKVHTTGNAGMNGIHEAIKSGVIEYIAKENRVILETKLIESLFQEIRKNGLAGYGLDEVDFLLQNGAVDHLLIIDKLVRTEKGEELLRLTQSQQTKFTIINSMHEAGKKLEGIGGVGALLRFLIQDKNG
ncbi:MAG: mRNA surveillance protein pelota [Promethearchaeota archaeon]